MAGAGRPIHVMDKSVFTALASLAATALSMAFTTPAVADGTQCTNALSCGMAEPVGDACRIVGFDTMDPPDDDGLIVSRSFIEDNGLYDVEMPDSCMRASATFGLQGFVMNNYDRSLQRVGVLQSRTLYRMTARSDSGREGEGIVWMVPLPDRAQIRRLGFDSCRGSCVIQLGDVPEGTVPVLAGFQLTRSDGAGHLREFGITLLPDGGSYRVDFDDDGFDFFGVVVVALVPQGSVLDQVDFDASYDGRDCGGLFQPACLFGPADRPHPELRHTGPRGDAVLQSFHFEFRDGGQYFRRMGVERLADGYAAWFQNSGYRDDDFRWPDEAFHWSVSYVILRPSLLEAPRSNPDPFVPIEIVPAGPFTFAP